MSLKVLTIPSGATNDDLGRLILELHACIEENTAATNARVTAANQRIDGVERQMAQNARSAIEVFVTRAEIAEKLNTITKAVGVPEGGKPEHTPLARLANLRLRWWQWGLVAIGIGGGLSGLQALTKFLVAVVPVVYHLWTR